MALFDSTFPPSLRALAGRSPRWQEYAVKTKHQVLLTSLLLVALEALASPGDRENKRGLVV